MVSKFESLPNEIIQKVLANVNNTSYLKQCMLVCKNWKELSQEHLYATIKLYSVSQLLTLLNTFETNSYLTHLVKGLILSSQSDDNYDHNDSNVAVLLEYLPNLEYVDVSRGQHFKVLYNALLANQLPHLNCIEPPANDEETQDYISCAVILKDLLKKLSLNESVFWYNRRLLQTESANQFYRLLDKLNEFKKVEDLSIMISTNSEVNTIIKVTNNCPLLKRLSISFGLTDSNVYNFSANISNTINESNVLYLKLSRFEYNNSRLMQYIIYRFPHLQVIHMDGKAGQTNYLEEIVFGQFLNFLSTIKQVQVFNVPFEKEYFISSIGSFWNATSQIRDLYVYFYYSTTPFHEVDTTAIIYRNNRIINHRFEFNSFSTTGFKHANILEKYGRYIEGLAFDDVDLNSEEPTGVSKQMLYEMLFAVPHQYCAKLKYLYINNYTLGGLDIPDNEAVEKRTLDFLFLQRCTIDKDRFFTNLTKLYADIHCLNLLSIKNLSDEYHGDTVFDNIHMEDTDIRTLTLSEASVLRAEQNEELILLKITIQRNIQYYLYNFKCMTDLEFKAVKKDEYNKELNRVGPLVINLSCKSIQSIKVACERKYIKLN